MNILKKFTIKNLKLNKKRAVGTVIGIILSVALICAVAGMFVSLQATLVQNTINEYGYYHIALDGINQEKYEKLKLNKDVKDMYKLYSLGHAKYISEENPEEEYLIQVYSSTKEDLDSLRFNIIEGREARSSDEIVLSKTVMDNSNYKIGDVIEFDVGIRKTLDGYDLNDHNPYHKDLEQLVNPVKKWYKVVGVVKRSNWGYVYYGVTTNGSSDKMKAYVSLKNPKDYNKSIPEMLGVSTMAQVYSSEERDGFYCTINNELLRWEVFKFSSTNLSMLYSLAGVVITIIIITSVFCIRNSFAISTLEKMKMYGMLASVGATRKQIRKSVIYEGLILGTIGIPLGILSGIFADFVLIKVVNLIIGDFLLTYVDGLVFKVSIIAIVISVILGIVTIYLSSIFSAIKAGRVSPIENLRSSNEIKITSKKLKVPSLVSSIYKTGGELAYKNLKRSKKKYRTTVISLAVSILVFISMSAFINEGVREGASYYIDYDYNVRLIDVKVDSNEFAQIKKLNNYKKMYLTYDYNGYFRGEDLSYLNKYDDEDSGAVDTYYNIELVALDDATFREYAKKSKISYDDVKEKGILCDEYVYISNKTNKETRARKYKYKKGDIIKGKLAGEEMRELNIKVGAVSTVKPYGYEGHFYDDGFLVVNKDYFSDVEFRLVYILVNTKNSEKFVKDVKDISKDIKTMDFDAVAKEDKAMILVMSIFLYGFIAVITLIGVTNIFNTITSNMELRSKEFAMLKSIGMTKKEFNRMINLETLFYCSKSLIYGIILGLVGAYYIHRSFAIRVESGFIIPYVPILISIVFVFIIVSMIMRYSIRKIDKLNTIETIRNENI